MTKIKCTFLWRFRDRLVQLETANFNLCAREKILINLCDTYEEHGLPSHPSDRQETSGLALEVVVPVDAPAHPEVRDLDRLVGTHHAIPGRQTTVSEIKFKRISLRSFSINGSGSAF